MHATSTYNKISLVLLTIYTASGEPNDQPILRIVEDIACPDTPRDCQDFYWDETSVRAVEFVVDVVESIQDNENLTAVLASLQLEDSEVLNKSLSTSRRKKRFTLPPVLLPIIQLFLMYESAKMLIDKSRKQPCYERVGCFNYTYKMSLPGYGPSPPERVGTKFILYNEDQIVYYTPWDGNFTEKFLVKGPLFLTFPGWNEGVLTKWIGTLFHAVCRQMTCYFIFVDWISGSFGVNYLEAASNTPMVGAEASLLLQKLLQSNTEYLNASDVHLIGFSLGAHAAGFCGRHFFDATGEKLGRITGLDPAGPLFDDTEVALRKGDAAFVDIIHTNAGTLKTLQLGINTPTGDVDFFINGGSWQPNCRIPIGCSHTRAPYLFIESINHSCSFTSGGQTGNVGYYSITSQLRGNFNVVTNEKPPYCKNTETAKKRIPRHIGDS